MQCQYPYFVSMALFTVVRVGYVVNLLRMDISDAYRISTLKFHVYKQRGSRAQIRKYEEFQKEVLVI